MGPNNSFQHHLFKSISLIKGFESPQQWFESLAVEFIHNIKNTDPELYRDCMIKAGELSLGLDDDTHVVPDETPEPQQAPPSQPAEIPQAKQKSPPETSRLDLPPTQPSVPATRPSGPPVASPAPPPAQPVVTTRQPPAKKPKRVFCSQCKSQKVHTEFPHHDDQDHALKTWCQACIPNNETAPPEPVNDTETTETKPRKRKTKQFHSLDLKDIGQFPVWEKLESNPIVQVDEEQSCSVCGLMTRDQVDIYPICPDCVQEYRISQNGDVSRRPAVTESSITSQAIGETTCTECPAQTRTLVDGYPLCNRCLDLLMEKSEESGDKLE